MKKCPTCEKTFDDSMRFCQSDGTPLVAASEPVDPYKTMVASADEIASAVPPRAPEQVTEPPKREDDVLDLPKQDDPLKTMYASEDEIRREMSGRQGHDEQVIEIPPLAPAATPEPPKFIAHDANRRSDPPPPSPFGSSDTSPSASESSRSSGEPRENLTTPPIPSPFSETKSPAREPERGIHPSPTVPDRPGFPVPDRSRDDAAVNPFDAPRPQQDWSPPPEQQDWSPPPVQQDWSPPVPVGGWQNSPETPGAAPGSSDPGLNQTLAIVSLVLGIISIVLCQLTGPVAVVLGFMARGKASKYPAEYGGGGLALGGIITGVIGTLFLALVILYLIFVFGIVAFGSF